MFRKMRRFNQQLEENECIKILESNNTGVLALSDDYPYALPLNYFYKDHKIYFHSAIEGHKVDIIKKNNKASFCVIHENTIIKEEYTCDYKSVIVFGKINVVEDKAEMFKLFSSHLAPNQDMEALIQKIDRNKNYFILYCLDIEHMSGKKRR